MSEQYISLVAESDLLREALKIASNNGAEVGDPTLNDSSSDILNFQIGAAELKQALEIATVLFKSGAAMLTFYKVLRDLLKSKNQTTIKILIKNPVTGKQKGVLKADTTDAELALLGADK